MPNMLSFSSSRLTHSACSALTLALVAVCSVGLTGCAGLTSSSDSTEAAVKSTCKQTVADSRTEVCAAERLPVAGKAGESVGTLVTTNSAAADQARKAGIAVKMLPDEAALEGKPWAIITVPAAELKTKAAYSAAQTTQAVTGTPVRLLDSQNGWWRVQLPEGYIARVHRSQLLRLTDDEIFQWNVIPRVVVTAPETHLETADGKPAGILYAGAIAVAGDVIRDEKGNALRQVVQLPDGRNVSVDAKDVKDLNAFRVESAVSRGKGREAFGAKLAEIALSLIGRSYLWGGTTPAGMDCSGFLSVVFRMNDLILPRDSDQMAGLGELDDAPDSWQRAQAGDLLFFGRKTEGKSFSSGVSHVALALGNGRFIHSLGDVHTASFNPESPEYDAYEAKRYLGRVRLRFDDWDNPCLTSTGTNALYGVPPAAPKPCKRVR